MLRTLLLVQQSAKKTRKRYTSLDRLSAKAHKEKYRIPQHIHFPGYRIIFDPAPDGSCQFAALSYQLAALGIYRTATTIRHEVCEYLHNHRFSCPGMPDLASFILLDNGLSDDENYDRYVRRMRLQRTFGEQITLVAAAERYNIDINVFSTGGIPVHIRASQGIGRQITLGHLSEDNGLHYFAIAPEENVNYNIDIPSTHNENEPVHSNSSEENEFERFVRDHQPSSKKVITIEHTYFICMESRFVP